MMADGSPIITQLDTWIQVSKNNPNVEGWLNIK